MNLTEKLDQVVDGLCERRALRPLKFLLRAYPGVLAHTDQIADLLDALRDFKGLCRHELTEEELRLVVESINELEDCLARRLGPP